MAWIRSRSTDWAPTGIRAGPATRGFRRHPHVGGGHELPDRAHDPAGHHRTGEASRLRVLLPTDDYYSSIIDWQSTRNGVTGLTREAIGYENGVWAV